MAQPGKSNRLDQVMALLDVRAITLARASGADHSLVTKWRRGERALTRRSEHLPAVAAALVQLDPEGRLAEQLAPYRQLGEDPVEAMCEYLTSEDLPGLAPRAAPPKRRTSGEYLVQHRVYLGNKGLRNATIALLDYVATLPPGREVVVVCHSNFNWLFKNMAFAALLMNRVERTMERSTTLTLICRRGYSISDTAAFAILWMWGHLRGFLRSRYYEGEPPSGERIVASIRDYWSLRAHEDDEVEDGLFAAMYTDPLDVRQDAKTCAEYARRSKPLAQFDFLASPRGTKTEPKLWKKGPLPAWPHTEAPSGTLHAIARVPGVGLVSQAEFAQLCGDARPDVPDYLFLPQAGFARGMHRIILCREDVREGLVAPRRHEQLSVLLHRDVMVPPAMLAAQLARLLAAMERDAAFQVALVPRVSFNRFRLDLTCWRHSACVAFLHEGGNSAFSCEKVTSGPLHASVAFYWHHLLAGWRRQEKVKRQLNKWLAGKELTLEEDDSAIVRGWDVLPRR